VADNKAITLEEHLAKIRSLGGKARAAALSPEQLSTIGRKAGKVGGKARAEALTSEQRRDIARKAGKAGAAARWGKKPPA